MENKKLNKYLDFFREIKSITERERDGDTDCS